jgi:hypothetical protein
VTAAWLWAALASSSISAAPASAGDKPYGLIVLVTGTGSDWKKVMADVAKKVEGEFPVLEAPATDRKQIQQAIDKLKAARVKKIVVVPLELSSYSVLMDQVRYLLGIRKEPSADFLLGAKAGAGGARSDVKIKRVVSKVPVVLSTALDDAPVVADLLAARALAQTKRPGKEAVLMIAQASQADIDNSQWLGVIESLGPKVMIKGGFAAAKAVVLPSDAPQAKRDEKLRELRTGAQQLRRQAGSLIVLPLTLDRERSPRAFPTGWKDSSINSTARPSCPMSAPPTGSRPPRSTSRPCPT